MIPFLERKYFLSSLPSGSLKKETDTDITVRCPICGDSDKDKRKARGHFYIKSNMDIPVYHCFNCGFSGSLQTFLKEVNSNIYDLYRKEVRQLNFKEMKSEKERIGSSPDLKKKSLEIYSFKLPKQFLPISSSKVASSYLVKRKIDSSIFFFCKEKVSLRGKDLPLENCIITPLWYNKDKLLLYGFQARSVKEKFFFTYIPEENSGLKFWVDSDLNSNGNLIFLTEGVFDSLSIGFPNRNIGAILGSSENQYFKHHFTNVIYCLDNQHIDQASMKKTKELLKLGEKCFIWGKNTKEKDFNELLMNGTKKEEIKEMILKNIYYGVKGFAKLI